jgi:hypothetical protein
MPHKLEAVLRMPADERNSRIKRAFKSRWQLYTSKVIYSTFGYWLNRRRSRYIFEFRPDSHYEFSKFDDYNALLDIWLAGNRHMNCGDLARFYALCLNLKQVLDDGVPGDLVELGVYKGNSAGMLAAFARRHHRRVFLFDTFEGFDQRDLRGLDSNRVVQFQDTSLSAVQALVGTDSVTYAQGFFPESASKITMPERIAVAHIDCDLYEPMKAGLEYFYPLLSPGGIMLLHDYSSGHWPGATRAIDEFVRNIPEKPVLLPDKSGTAVIRKLT